MNPLRRKRHQHRKKRKKEIRKQTWTSHDQCVWILLSRIIEKVLIVQICIVSLWRKEFRTFQWRVVVFYYFGDDSRIAFSKPAPFKNIRICSIAFPTVDSNVEDIVLFFFFEFFRVSQWQQTTPQTNQLRVPPIERFRICVINVRASSMPPFLLKWVCASPRAEWTAERNTILSWAHLRDSTLCRIPLDNWTSQYRPST